MQKARKYLQINRDGNYSQSGHMTLKSGFRPDPSVL